MVRNTSRRAMQSGAQNENEMLIFSVTSIIMLLCSAIAPASFVSNYTALCCILVYLITIYRSSYAFFIKYVHVIFGMAGFLAGIFLIEMMPSFYMVELRTASHKAGAFPLGCFAYTLYIFSIRTFENKQERFQLHAVSEWDNLQNNLKVCDWIAVFFGLSYMLAFLKVVRTPSFLLGLDRFAYSSRYALTGAVAYMVKLSSFLLLFPIISVIYGNRKLGIISIGFYVLYTIWTGGKFGPFFELLVLVCIALYKNILRVNEKKTKKILFLVFLAIGILILFSVFLFSFVQQQDTYLYTRLSQQGQLWWRTYDLCQSDGMHFTEFGDELKALVNGNANISSNIGSSNGIYKIMYYTTPSAVVDAKLARGSRYTAAGFAAAYYYFGVFGVVFFSVFMGYLMALVTNKLLKAISEGNIIKIILFGRFFSISRTAFSMFEFLSFFDIESIASYIYFFFRRKVKSIRIRK